MSLVDYNINVDNGRPGEGGGSIVGESMEGESTGVKSFYLL